LLSQQWARLRPLHLLSQRWARWLSALLLCFDRRRLLLQLPRAFPPDPGGACTHGGGHLHGSGAVGHSTCRRRRP